MKKISLSVSLLFLAAVLGLGTGCVKKPDDAKIAGDIQNKFSQDSGLSGKQLTVQASEGTVTLGGTVDSDSQREAASRQAASVPGVKQVINNLQVGTAPVARSAEPPAPSPVAESKPEPSRPAKKSHKSHATENAGMNDGGSAMGDRSGDTMAKNSTPPPSPAQVTTPPPAPAPPPPPKKVTVDQGTQLSVRLVDPVDSEKNQTGQTFHATLNTPLTSDGEEVVPAGSDVVGHIAELKSAGKFAGQSVVVLQLDSITSGGRTYNIQTDQYKKQGSSRGKNTAEKVGRAELYPAGSGDRDSSAESECQPAEAGGVAVKKQSVSAGICRLYKAPGTAPH